MGSEGDRLTKLYCKTTDGYAAGVRALTRIITQWVALQCKADGALGLNDEGDHVHGQECKEIYPKIDQTNGLERDKERTVADTDCNKRYLQAFGEILLYCAPTMCMSCANTMNMAGWERSGRSITP